MKDKDIRRLINMCDAPDEKSESAVSAEEVRSLVMAKVKGKKKEGFADTENIASMKLVNKPAPELNNKLKAELYQKETAMRKQPIIRSFSLWYLPMILNLATFIMLAVVALMVINNTYLSYFAVGICSYIGLVGVLLTIVGIKRTNMKENITIRIEKRGALV